MTYFEELNTKLKIRNVVKTEAPISCFEYKRKDTSITKARAKVQTSLQPYVS